MSQVVESNWNGGTKIKDSYCQGDCPWLTFRIISWWLWASSPQVNNSHTSQYSFDIPISYTLHGVSLLHWKSLHLKSAFSLFCRFILTLYVDRDGWSLYFRLLVLIHVVLATNLATALRGARDQLNPSQKFFHSRCLSHSHNALSTAWSP